MRKESRPDLNQHDGDWERFRLLNPITRKWAYFDNAAVAAVSLPAREAMQKWLSQAVDDGDTEWPNWCRQFESTRQSASQLIGASPEEIALVPNTTMGISYVAEGFPWKHGDNVVTLNNEFPTNQYPWLNLSSRGVETRQIETKDGQIDLEQLAEACDHHTRIVTVSWVGFSSGWRVDLERLTAMVHSRGALLFLDAIQGLGVFPLNVNETPVDFLAADGHKWLLGPEGAGVFYLRREHLNLLRPIGVGWNSVVNRGDYSRIELNIRDEAARYEGGTWNTGGFIGLGASIDMLMDFGSSSTHSAVADRILTITDELCERLKSVGARIASTRSHQSRSGIVSFELPGVDPNAFRRSCLNQRIVISLRNGCLRISPHAYCNDDDIQRLLSQVEYVKRSVK